MKHSLAGITQYRNKNNTKIDGIIKHRYSDFLVCETFKNEKPLTLTQKETAAADPALENTLGENCRRFLETIDKEQPKTELKACTDPIGEKDTREKIHCYIRNRYGGRVSTKTLQENRIMLSTGKDRKATLSFSLYKENTGTTAAIETLGKALRKNTRSFSFAGTKDKRAVTIQKVSVRETRVDELENIALPHNLRIGNIAPSKKPVQLGEHSGNHFHLFIRNIATLAEMTHEEKTGKIGEIRKNIEAIKQNGFINYFGMQRFGVDSETPTHTVGAHMMRGEWEKACKTILGSSSKTRNFIERKIEKHLEKRKEDYKGALDALPWSTRTLYLHALQSYLWNFSVSKVLEEGADELHAVPGYRHGDFSQTVKDAMLQLGLSPEVFAEACKRLNLPGTQRKTVVVPENLGFAFVEYTDINTHVLEKELAAMRGENREEAPLDYIEYVDEIPQTQAGAFLGLKLSFSLPQSSYATMLLRELLRNETGAQHHAASSAETLKAIDD
ncbi:MAG: pseudouridine synthase [Amphiamblys sp. WSBS2006]|nr:MAG: pseudouridine synthase [Amphiamblys sp. WSBS2006]